MALVTVSDTTLTDIADAIRSKNGQETLYKPSEMPEAIEAISGGGITPTGTIEITQNGVVDVTNYASADVDVPQGITPTGTKQISITENGTTTEDVTNYANAEIAVNVSGSSIPRLLHHEEIIFETTASNTNKLNVQLTPSSSCFVFVLIDTWPSSPDASEYIALSSMAQYYPVSGGTNGNDILRPAGTVGTDGTMATFNTSTGVLSIGGQYGHFLAGTKYHVYQFEIGGAS